MRFRIDGVLRIMPAPQHEMADAIVSRIKVLAGLDITERRKPQDGAMRLPIGDREVELRVATLTSIHGETVVMRICIATAFFSISPAWAWTSGSVRR